MKWLRNAFAIESAEPSSDPEARQLADRICREIVRRRLTTPALVLLETVRPLNFVAAQTLHFFAPLLAVVSDSKSHVVFAEFLERRGSIDYLCTQVEAYEQQARQCDRERGTLEDKTELLSGPAEDS